jgi:hypothetical protein
LTTTAPLPCSRLAVPAPTSRLSSFSTAPSGRPIASSAGVLPVDDAPTSACHEPQLGEAVIVLGMMRAGLEPQDAGIGRGRLVGAGMEQHLARLARPADRLLVDLVETAHLAGQVIARRRLARGGERCSFFVDDDRRRPSGTSAGRSGPTVVNASAPNVSFGAKKD